MCQHNHDHNEERRGFLRKLGGALVGIIAFVKGAEASAADDVCGAKCISLPYDGGTCTKTGRHQFHRCSKDHSW